ncbi:GntR family transcriptional regulator [Streptomyces sp. P6-2-1]|uniref:GntR family transcriptional regulator n=1 Tax=unclassified Streptomyces TaxID=2593676 RepID=UPI003D36424A
MKTTPGDAAPLDAPSHEPLWVRAADAVERRVREGTLPAGSRLPSERELCAQLGISRVTLRKALHHLVERGVLRSSHGRGWYVAGGEERESREDREWPNSLESFTETARRKGLTPSSRVLRAEVRAATLDEAEEFGVAAGTELFLLDRVRLLDGLAIGVDQALTVLHLAPALTATDFADSSLVEVLSAAGSEPVHAESMIEARGCPAGLAPYLDLGEGAPVLVMDQAMTDAGGRPVLRSTLTYRGDRYRLRTVFVRGQG